MQTLADRSDFLTIEESGKREVNSDFRFTSREIIPQKINPACLKRPLHMAQNGINFRLFIFLIF
jgi:hypothetical protein